MLRHYRGPQAEQAPPATLELIPRVEYLLMLAEVVSASGAATRWSGSAILLETAQRHGMLGLETELQLAMGEVAYLLGDQRLARSLPGSGAGAGRRCNVQQALRELRLRQPGLLRELGLELQDVDHSDVGERRKSAEPA